MAVSQQPLVYAVVPVHNRRVWTLRFLEWFTRQSYQHVVVLLVDDGSTDGTADAVRSAYPTVRILEGDGTLWWSGATNMGVRVALEEGADYILTINDDAVGDDTYLATLVAAASEDSRRIVGSRLMRGDNPEIVFECGRELQASMRFCFLPLHAGQSWAAIQSEMPKIISTQTLCGDGVLIPAEVFRRVGFYEACWMPQYHADVDFILRAKAEGYLPCVAIEAALLNPIQVPRCVSFLTRFFSRRSTYYLPAVWLCLWRYGSKWKAPFALAYICLEGVVPARWKRWLRSLIRA